MKPESDVFSPTLFYSYSHRDAQFKNEMEKSLSLLRSDGLLRDWSDQNIRPGQNISREVRGKMNEADILAFLFSRDFIASEECRREWEFAKKLASRGKPVIRIPIILKECAWMDFLGSDDIKALPNDGKAVTSFSNRDTAWQQIYEGIKMVIYELGNTFMPKLDFVEEMEKTDFVAQQHVKLQDIFVFPTLSCYPPQAKDAPLRKETIKSQTELLKKGYVLIHGQEWSGKTALARHIFLSLTENQSTPVLHIDLDTIPRKSYDRIISEVYSRQFSGDYSLWKNQDNKTLILDNLTSAPKAID